MKKIIIFLCFLGLLSADTPVFKNPGIPAREYLEIKDYINKDIGFVLGKVNSELKQEKGKKYYEILVWENKHYQNKLKLNYDDLTTISEQRIDGRTGKVIEEFGQSQNGNITFKNSDKAINKYYYDADHNYYSRYAYMFSFRGFPFGQQQEVYFKTCMNEYAAAPLTMRLRNLGIENVKVKPGTIKCYKLELIVAGWQSAFNKDVYYLYFSVVKPHYFVRFFQKVEDGRWLSNELLKYEAFKN